MHQHSLIISSITSLLHVRCLCLIYLASTMRRALTRYERAREETQITADDDDTIELLQCASRDNFTSQPDETPLQAHLYRADTKGNRPYTVAASSDENFHARDLPVIQSRDDTSQTSLLAGWRVGALCCLIGTILVCIFNLAVTIHVHKGPYPKMYQTIGTLHQDQCAKIRTYNKWIHLAVNVVSTLLLCASNYCMQVLSAPNRKELVYAHSRRVWLHIGVPSLHNLKHISRARTALWMGLFISSVPLHLLFNSVVFTNRQANDYMVLPVTQEWLDGAPYKTSNFVNISSERKFVIEDTFNSWRWNQSVAAKANYVDTDTTACFETYNEQYVSGVGNVYIVQDDWAVWHKNGVEWPRFHSNGSFTWTKNSTALNSTEADRKLLAQAQLPFNSTPDFYPSNGWRCASQAIQTCDASKEIGGNKTQWQPYGAHIQYCKVEQVEERCKLYFSFAIATLVIIANFLKAICMALTLIMYRRHSPLVTLGDTVAHFLDHPDPETTNRCLFSRKLMEAQWNWEFTNEVGKDGLGIEPERYDPQPLKWQAAPSTYRWCNTYIMYGICTILSIVFSTSSIAGMPKDPAKRWKFGEIVGNNLLQFSTSLTGGILLANMPQVILSYLYLAFNALYTNMFVAREWSGYAKQRKPLRVTSPLGQQRDTYWLNVPFRWAIPMTITSGIFHWLVSQSIFLVQITVTNAADRQKTRQISTCAYSPVAIILCTIVGSVIAFGGIALGKKRYPAGMPMASSCSAAISAACHPVPEDAQASLRPLQWGATSHGEMGEDGSEPVGHCTFSGLPVEQPIPGRLYA
ncbi:hypothetical protein NX059_005828 [Plenodomus lindquistii]|nr:hypothetical protein NX059_005828 [Plenodomus lindquistii]